MYERQEQNFKNQTYELQVLTPEEADSLYKNPGAHQVNHL